MEAGVENPKEKMDSRMRALFALSIVFLVVGGLFLLLSFNYGVWSPSPPVGQEGVFILQLVYYFSPALFIMGLTGLLYRRWPIADRPEKRGNMPSPAIFGAAIIIIGIVYDLIIRISTSSTIESAFWGFGAIPSDFGGGGLTFIFAALIIVMMGYAIMRKEWTLTIIVGLFVLFINIIAVIGLILIVMAKDDLIGYWRRASWLSKIKISQAKILVLIGCIPPILFATSVTLVMMLQIQNNANWWFSKISEAIALFVTPPIVVIGAMRLTIEQSPLSQKDERGSSLRYLSSLGGIMILIGAVLILYIGLGTYFTYNFSIPSNAFDPLLSMIVVPFSVIGGLLAIVHRKWMYALLIGSTALLLIDPELGAIGMILIALSREAFVNR